MTSGKNTKAIVLISGAVFCVGLLHIIHLSVKDYGPEYIDRRGIFSHAKLSPAGGSAETEKFWLTVHNREGFSVDCGLLVPRDTAKRHPVVILLGGKATGKEAVDFALSIHDAIIAAPDYRYEPKKEYTILEFLADVPEIHAGLLDMVPAVMLLTDYLFRRPDVDTTRLVLVGYSFGAPFAPATIQHDRRAAAVCVVYGGGDLQSLIRHNVARYRGPLASALVGLMGGTLLSPLEPLRSIEYVSPIPLVMINGTADEQIPRKNVEILYERAREPKRLIWLESMHVHPRNVVLTERIIRTIQNELADLAILEHRNH